MSRFTSSIVPGLLLALALLLPVSLLPVTLRAAEAGPEAQPPVLKASIAEPVVVRPAIEPLAAKPCFGFQGTIARVSRPAPRIVLPQVVLPQESAPGRFEGFGGLPAKPACRVELTRPAPTTGLAEAASASQERVVAEVSCPAEAAPRARVDGYNPINPTTAPYKKAYRVSYTPNNSASNNADGCVDQDACGSSRVSDAASSCCEPRFVSCAPRTVRRVYYRPVVYAQPCGGGWGWGGGWRGGWGSGWRGGWGWGGGWRGGWGWGGGWRAGWGWGGGWGPYW